MATYYGYAERDANSYVDWGKLGQSLTETVQAAYKIREDKKQALDDLMQQNYAELANAPTGENQDINSAVIQHADNSKQYLLQINKLLKAGVLQPKDYTLINQNLSEDTKALFDNAKNWQTAYAKVLERNKNNTGSKAELALAAEVAAFGKFKDLQFMITPTTGRLNAAKFTKGANGEVVKGDTKTMLQLNVLMNQSIDKYKLTDKLVALEGALGENVISQFRAARVQANGQITEITDKGLRADYDATKKTFTDETTANPFNKMSILMDYKNTIPTNAEIDAMLKATPPLITDAQANEMRSMAGQAYTVSTNPNDFGKANVILYEDPDGDGSYTPKFTSSQDSVINKFVSDQFDGLIDRKQQNQAISAISPSYAPEYVYNAGKDQTEKDNAVGAWDKLRWGTPEEKQNAAETLMGTTIATNTKLEDIDLTSKPGYVLLKYQDSENDREIKITDKGDEWSAVGVVLHGENDVNKAKKAAGNTWGKPINTDYTNVRAQKQGNNYNAEMSSYTNQNVPSSIITDNPSQTASNLNAKFKDLGFVVRGDYELGLNGKTDFIIITAPDGSKSEKINVDNKDNVSQIQAFLNSKLDNAKAANVFKRQAGGSSGNAGGAKNSGGTARKG